MKKRMRLLFSQLLFVTVFAQLVFQPCLYAIENRGTYAVVGQQYLRSLPTLAPKKKSISVEDNKKVSLQKSFLKDQEKLTILLQVLSQADAQDTIDSITEDLLTDINVFYGHSADPSCALHKIMDRTTTVFGKAGLIKMLAQPSADIDMLQSRQALIKKMVEDTDFFIQIHNLLQKVRAAEDGFFSYWQQEDPEVTKLVNKVYWGKRMPAKFNKSAAALEIGTRLNNFATGLKLSFPAILMAVADCGAQYAMKREIDVKQMCKNTARSIANFFNPKPVYDGFKIVHSGKAYKDCCDRAIAQGMTGPGISEKGFNRANYAVLGLAGLVQAGIVGGYAYWSKVSLSKANENKNIINYLHTKLIDVATVTNTIKEIVELACDNEIDFRGLSAVADAGDLLDVDASKSAECKAVVDLLQKNTFKGSASFFSCSGRVLAAHTLFKQAKNEFAQALQIVGELDACLSMAKLYKESQHKKVSYSFAEYKKGDGPYIELEDFWNPFVDSNKAVVNTIILDGNQLPRGIVLTGSNTGGKSTLLKGVLINLLLAQTCGIVAAKKAVIVPCNRIVSSLNISDNTAAGVSLFQSEVNRAASIARVVKQAAVNNEFVFVGIDELFTGTSVDKGKQAAIQFAQELLKQQGCSFIFASHFTSVTELEQASNGVCKNMKMEASIAKDGSIVRPFKLEAGVSTHNIANAILAQQLNGFSSN